MKFKTFVYRTLSASNDARAIQKGKVPQRIVRKAVYRSIFRWVR